MDKKQRRLQKQVIREARAGGKGSDLNPHLREQLLKGKLVPREDVRSPWIQPAPPEAELSTYSLLHKDLQKKVKKRPY
jgi:hypothetical protein